MVFPRKNAKGKSIWYASFAYNKRQIEEKVGPNRREAERVEDDRKRQVKEGLYRPGAVSRQLLTLEAYVDEWCQKRVNKTAKRDEARLKQHVVPVLGNRRMRDLSAAECIEFVRGLIGTMSPKNIQNVWGVFRTLLRDAEIAKLIDFHPIMPPGVIPPRPPTIQDVYSNADVLKLCGSWTPTGILPSVLLYSGMRAGEACGLRWSDWDESPLPLGCLTVARQYDGLGHNASTKTGRPRYVPVHPTLARHLELWRSNWPSYFGEDPRPNDPICPQPSGEPHTRWTVYKRFVAHCRELSVPHMAVHRTRHTAITGMRRGGAPQDIVERVTHNAVGSMVDRYTHDWTMLCSAVSCLDYSGHGNSHGEFAKSVDSIDKKNGAGGCRSPRQIGTSANPRELAGQVGAAVSPDSPQIPPVDAGHGTLREHLQERTAAAGLESALDVRRRLGWPELTESERRENLESNLDAIDCLAPASDATDFCECCFDVLIREPRLCNSPWCHDPRDRDDAECDKPGCAALRFAEKNHTSQLASTTQNPEDFAQKSGSNPASINSESSGKDAGSAHRLSRRELGEVQHRPQPKNISPSAGDVIRTYAEGHSCAGTAESGPALLTSREGMVSQSLGPADGTSLPQGAGEGRVAVSTLKEPASAQAGDGVRRAQCCDSAAQQVTPSAASRLPTAPTAQKEGQNEANIQDRAGVESPLQDHGIHGHRGGPVRVSVGLRPIRSEVTEARQGRATGSTATVRRRPTGSDCEAPGKAHETGYGRTAAKKSRPRAIAARHPFEYQTPAGSVWSWADCGGAP